MTALSYKLPKSFIDKYKRLPVSWGFQDAGGNSLGEITFLRTYSRVKEDGTKERWFEVCERVVNGMFSIVKDHCAERRVPWDDDHAFELAAEAYDRMFHFKWTPPGRGLWMMGTDYVHARRDSTALQNCGFVSTSDVSAETFHEPFAWLMHASMLGVGIGFDTLGAAKKIMVHDAVRSRDTYVVPDSREGWVESVSTIVRAYVGMGVGLPDFDYSQIRPKGTPIRGFGGTASGPEPLKALHRELVILLSRYAEAHRAVDSRLIVDIANLVGKCVVAGNVRRSAEIAIGLPDDADFMSLKNYALPANEYRTGPEGWSWISNNSVFATVGMDYNPFLEHTTLNGEPGYVYMDLCRQYGRMKDPVNNRDWRAAGTNPCSEQTLESYEMCTLVETYPVRCESMEDWHRTLKFAYLYAKAVTLLPTSFQQTNAVMQRNHRIGCSASGLAQFLENGTNQAQLAFAGKPEHRGWAELRAWLDKGYQVVTDWDRVYSEWLCVRESVKKTSIKPSGTVSLLAGVAPGVHWPIATTMIRRVRMEKDSALVQQLEAHGYHVEPAYGNADTTVVVEFPIRGLAMRTEREVSIFEKAEIAALAQSEWADNQVSVTITFDPETEAKHVGTVLRIYEGRFKSVSFLPMGNDTFPQMPYSSISEAEYEEVVAGARLKPLDWDVLYDSGTVETAIGEAYCTNDHCEVPLPGSEELLQGQLAIDVVMATGAEQ